MLRLEEVSTPEMAEVLAINALAPAVINGRLKAFMERSGVPTSETTPPPPPGIDEPAPDPHDIKFIVNVSAMEGRFYKVHRASLDCGSVCYLPLRSTFPAFQSHSTSSRRTRTPTWPRRLST